ncbi:MAG TPA: hypothetical protein VGM88_10970 [Kofleriaceae bacterium]|jgi:hypothetical protein
MAEIRLLSWNIQVYGPRKYSNANNTALARFVGAVARAAFPGQGPTLITVMEIMSTVNEQVSFSISDAIGERGWNRHTLQARANGNRESYALFWADGANVELLDYALAEEEFPNNFSPRKGRKAAVAVFRATDTNTQFAVSTYHAPPNARAVTGLQQLARVPWLYAYGGAPVPARMLAGDFNLDGVIARDDYRPLTDAPPDGAGCVPITSRSTLLVDGFAGEVDTWPTVPWDYARDDAGLDNIFYVPSIEKRATGGAMNVLEDLGDRGQVYTALGQFAPVFPHGDRFGGANTTAPLMSQHLGYGFLAYRYAVSDHLPVRLRITV